MKTKHLNVLWLFFIAAIFSTTISSAQVWHANADSGNFLTYFESINFQDCQTTSNNPGVAQEDFNGFSSKVWKQTCPRFVQRNEFSRPRFNHRPGQTYYYSWRVRIVPQSNSIAGNFNGKFAIFQFKTTSPGSQNHPVTIRYENNRLDFLYFKPCERNGNFVNWDSRSNAECGPDIRRHILTSVSYTPGKWVEIVLGIKKGTAKSGPNAGFVRLWVDGNRQTLTNLSRNPVLTFTGKTDDAQNYTSSNPNPSTNERSVYAKFGIYSGDKCPWSVTTYTHDLKAFTTSGDALASLQNTRQFSGGSSTGATNWPEISPGKYIWASSQWANSYSPSKANDGNLGTWWASQQYFYNNNYIAYDLGAHYEVKKVKLNFSGARMSKFRIWGDNGYGWYVIGEYNNPYTSPIVDNLYQTVRWISVQALEQNYSWVDLYEFDVFGNYKYGKQENNKPTAIEGPPAHKVKVLEERSIKVAPNPVTNNFTINLENITKAEVTITDLLGKTVYKTTTENNTIELSKGSTFKSGMYIITAKDELGTTHTSKLIVN